MAMRKTEIALNNGEVVTCSLGFVALKNLRHKDQALYKFANKAIAKGVEGITDTTKLIYAGYLAVCEGEPMSESEFGELLPDSYQEQVELLSEILK
jgi:predicted oxidoreductase